MKYKVFLGNFAITERTGVVSSLHCDWPQNHVQKWHQNAIPKSFWRWKHKCKYIYIYGL